MLVSNLHEIREEAIKRSKMAIFAASKAASRKEIRELAFASARETIELMNLVNRPNDRLTEGQIELLAHKATLVAMRSYR